MRLANLCDRLKALPHPGGLWNQRVDVLTKLETALRAIDDVNEKKMEEEAKKNK